MGHIRIAARALIVRDGRVLMTHCRDERGDWYLLPGGGQQVGESLPAALARECREELGVDVEVSGLIHVRDYIPAEGDFSYLSATQHQLELFFKCSVPDDYVARNGPQSDTNQVDVVWLDPEELKNNRVFPARLGEVVNPQRAAALPFYWGTEN